MAMIGWLVVIIAFAAIELNTMALTTIWFAGGALAAFLMAFLGFSIQVQLVVFLLISLVLLIFTRPFASKFINKGTVKTNAEGLIGKKARVTAEINNQLSQGSAVINGQEWTARAVSDEAVIPTGTIVYVRDIRGVKLIVEEGKENK